MFQNSLWWVPLTAGLEDAINPCVLVTAVIFICWMGWLSSRLANSDRHAIVFIGVFYVLMFMFNVGIAQGLLYAPATRQWIRMVYLFLGFLCILSSMVFIRDWRLLVGGQGGDLFAHRLWQWGRVSSATAWVVTVGLAIATAVLASIWPMNYYMGIIANNVLLPGQFWSTVFSIGVYTAVAISPVYAVFFLMRLLKLNARLFFVIAAAISLAGSIGAVYFIK